MGEVFPEGGGLARRAGPLPREAEDAKQAAILKISLRTRSGFPILGSCLVRREGQRENFEWLLPHRPAFDRTGEARKLTALFLW